MDFRLRIYAFCVDPEELPVAGREECAGKESSDRASIQSTKLEGKGMSEKQTSS